MICNLWCVSFVILLFSFSTAFSGSFFRALSVRSELSYCSFFERSLLFFVISYFLALVFPFYMALFLFVIHSAILLFLFVACFVVCYCNNENVVKVKHVSWTIPFFQSGSVIFFFLLPFLFLLLVSCVWVWMGKKSSFISYFGLVIHIYKIYFNLCLSPSALDTHTKVCTYIHIMCTNP